MEVLDGAHSRTCTKAFSFLQRNKSRKIYEENFLSKFMHYDTFTSSNVNSKVEGSSGDVLNQFSRFQKKTEASKVLGSTFSNFENKRLKNAFNMIISQIAFKEKQRKAIL